ncbi:MAG: corrinoid protein [Caldilineaceae bacterium]|nr:corrinoid protein [Caldilineaceae bacterium]MBP8123057.1 corrinoid protein [Caldilineaceae bacterium]MBP9073404.1 corrinoid protein [Caldilineaceae bacterium]
MSLEAIYNAVLTGNAGAAKDEVNLAVESGVSAEKILNEACIPAMTEVGRLFEIGETFVPEMLIAARAMSAATTILKPLLAKEGVEQIGTVIIGTVAGDLHDIGKNLVGMMMEGAGFKIIDLGTDVSPQKFVDAVKTENPDIIAMSALLTTTTRSMINTINALNEAGVRGQVKVMVGGAPITQDFADKVGADGFAADAGSAARKAKEMLGLAA